MMYEGLSLAGYLSGPISTKEYLAILKELANAYAYIDIDERVIPSQGKIYDLFDGSNNHSSGLRDDVQTTAISALSIGDTDIVDKVDTSDTSSWFQTGQEITIQDDENKEWVTVTEGGVTEEETTIDKSTPVTVVASAYTTSASARPQRLSNGWIVTAERNGNTDIRIQVDKQDGNGFIPLCYISANSHFIALASKGTQVFVLRGLTDFASLQFCSFDATAVTNSDVVMSNFANVDSSQIAFSGCSLTINSDQTELHAAWSSKNATYPNSFNIRYCKGTIASDGSVMWGSVVQVTTYNTSGHNGISNPCIVHLNGNQYIFAEWSTTIYRIMVVGDNFAIGLNLDSIINDGWYGKTIYDGSSYAQSRPSADVDLNGVIWVSWDGLDSTDTSSFNIHCKYSTDSGVTWQNAGSSDKLTSGNSYHQQYSSITHALYNNIFIVWCGKTSSSSGYFNIRQIKWNGTSWESVTEITTSTTSDILFPSSCSNYSNFTDPLIVYKTTSDVKFRGVWTEIVQTPHLIASELQNSYKANALIYRSLGKIVDGKMGFSDGFLGSVPIDVSTPVTVVSSAYTTSASARPQRLSNGWVVTCEKNGTTNVKFQVNKFDGNGFVDLCYITGNFPYFSISGKGTFIYWAITYSDAVYFSYFDVTTVSNTNVIGTAMTLDNSQAAFSGCSLTINADQTELHAAWSSKNATYPNSFNIRYCKGTIAGDGSVTWGSVEQITTDNTSGADWKNPCIVTVNGNPFIFMEYAYASNNGIYLKKYNGSTWSNYIEIYFGGTYAQSSPFADVAPDGSIWVSWHGKDGVDVSYNHIHCKKSSDSGATWVQADGTAGDGKLTSGSTVQNYSSVTIDGSNNVYILWNGVDTSIDASMQQVRKLKWNGSSWSSITTLTNITSSGTAGVSTCNNYRDFSDPLAIYKDGQAVAVKFRGVFEGTDYIPLLEEDIRYNITPPLSSTNKITLWTDNDKPESEDFSVATALSLVDIGADENYTAMSNTETVSLTDTTEENEFQGSGENKAKVNVRFTLTRNAVTVDKGINKITGVVGF